jgi:hypothetical protein
MSKLIRQTVYFLMITLVINAGGWTFNKEAVADVWFDEQRSLVIDDDHSSAETKDLKTVSHQSTCNHWCHAVGHFVGLLGQPISVLPEFVDEYSVQQPPFFQFLSPDARFRPPRLLF